jgi:nucleotide-binding universal stress UspA family protein
MSDDLEPLEATPAAGDRHVVLAAVDFSEDSRAALRWACHYAGLIGGRLVVLHVVHDPADQPGYYRASRGNHLQPMQQVAETMLDDFVGSLLTAPGAPPALASAEHRLVTGLPPGRIVDTAEQLRAELIVIGSRGMSGLPHIMQGSVSERVVELADRPVVVVKARGKRQREEAKRRKKEAKKRHKAEKQARKIQEAARAAGTPQDRGEPGSG